MVSARKLEGSEVGTFALAKSHSGMVPGWGMRKELSKKQQNPRAQGMLQNRNKDIAEKGGWGWGTLRMTSGDSSSCRTRALNPPLASPPLATRKKSEVHKHEVGLGKPFPRW